MGFHACLFSIKSFPANHANYLGDYTAIGGR